MDLNVHREILFLGLQRAANRLGRTDLIEHFQPLWLGNWLTDMNQASAFFDVLEGDHKDPYSRWRADGTYIFPMGIESHRDEWLNMYRTLWEKEWEAAQRSQRFGSLRPTTARPASADDIGGYFPYDHFDVVDHLDDDGKVVGEDEEFADPKSLLMTKTAYDGVFVQCKWRQLHKVFSQTNDRDDVASLRMLGQATHTLQDFFAHSNYVEVLLGVAAKEGLLPSHLADVLTRERAGTYAAYHQTPDPAAAMVMTGRFDQIDTVASILKIYRNSLVPRWKDLDASGFQPKQDTTRDLMIEVLFGTFSDHPFSSELLDGIKKAVAVRDFVSALGTEIEKGVIEFFTSVAELFADDEVDEQIDEVRSLLLAASSSEAKDFAKAGRILYLEHVIEQKLRAKVEQATGPCLPHHTLLAKDHDVRQPEVRLAFKIACAIATDVTADILIAYFGGEDPDAVDSILGAYYRHPTGLLGDSGFDTSLRQCVSHLYGCRWWLYASDEDNRIRVSRGVEG